MGPLGGPTAFELGNRLRNLKVQVIRQLMRAAARTDGGKNPIRTAIIAITTNVQSSKKHVGSERGKR